MTYIQKLFLDIVKCALSGKKYVIPSEIEEKDILELLKMAEAHEILPIVIECIYPCFFSEDKCNAVLIKYREKAITKVIIQIEKTSRFLQRYDEMRTQGFRPLVLKGLICRQLYPMPDYRSSTDEDILIPDDQFAGLEACLKRMGMEELHPQSEGVDQYETSYVKKPEYLEVHRSLFDPESSLFGTYNQYFEEIHANPSKICIQGYEILTPQPTFHFLFLVLHSFKHFIYHGFGIRQICDINLFRTNYSNEIDWEFVKKVCCELKVYDFLTAIFAIGEKYLRIKKETSCLPADWDYRRIDEMPLLLDCLDAGLLGVNDMNRVHSANLSLSYLIENQYQGAHPQIIKCGLVNSIFPSFKYMKTKYRYLGKFPFLLPWFWCERLLKYIVTMARKNNDSPIGVIRIAKEREKLFKKYNII